MGHDDGFGDDGIIDAELVGEGPSNAGPAPYRALDAEAQDFVREAAAYLERPGFLIRASNTIGKPAEALLRRLPGPAGKLVDRATEAALRRAMEVALVRLPRRGPIDPDAPIRELVAATFHRGSAHTMAVGAAGFAGGMWGAAALPLELPATTIVMLRAIAEIAAQMGVDLDDPAERLACVAVFAMGDGRRGDEAADIAGHQTSYYASRVGLQRGLQTVARWAASSSADEVAKAVLRGKGGMVGELLAKLVPRFGTVVGQKTALQLLPVIGAATAAGMNVAFLDHYHQVARYHFGLRLLEKRHGHDAVRLAFEDAARALPPPAVKPWSKP